MSTLNKEKRPWIEVAEKEIGVKEIVNGENPRILEYHSCTALAALEDEVPWCSSFVNWVMQQTGHMKTGSAAARSWMNYGTRLHKFTPQSIVILNIGGYPKAHVGFAIEDLGEYIKVLGGNQKDSVCYQLYPADLVLGYRWPIKLGGRDQS